MASTTPPQYSYTPPTPIELSYYNALFAIADKSSAGYLSGPSAVEFFLLSKLPLELLKTIWTMADQPSTNTLDSKKFYVAVRLIQLFQNGKKPVDLALNVMMDQGGTNSGMKPPYFEGVEIPQLALPPSQQQQQQQQPQQQQQGNNMGQTQQHQQPQQQQVMPLQQPQQQSYPSPQVQPMVAAAAASSPQRSPVLPPTGYPSSAMPSLPIPTTTTTTLAIQDPYTMTPQELSRYDALFPMYATQDTTTDDGKMYVHGATAVELFCKSGMDRESLKGIWTMVDDPIDNKLDSVEFAVAMHLIVCVTKKGLPTPLTLPSSLVNLVQYARSQQQQQQTQPQQQHQQQASANSGVGRQSVMGVSGESMTPQRTPPRGGGVGGGGGIPTPDNQGGLQQQFQQPQMNGGMNYSSQLPQYQPQQQQQQAQQPSLQQQKMTMPFQAQQGAQQQPWLAQQQGVPQTGSFGMQSTGIPQTSSFGGSGAAAAGKLSISDAFADVSNDPVADVDEYSTIASDTRRDTIGGGEAAATQSVPTWEMSPRPPLLPSLQHHPVQGQPGQFQQQQQQHEQLPPRSPRGPPKSPRSSRIPVTSPAISSEDSAAELLSLREAQQKLQAEVISLRAKAASVTDEELQVQKEMKSVASEIGKLSLELSTLKDSVMEAKMKLGESVGVLKVQMGKKEFLEAQVAEARMTHEALNSAAVAVEEANELAMTMKARAVAAGAAYKDDEANPAPAPLVSHETPVETADLFSWDAPSDVSPAPSIQVGATSSSTAQEYSHQSSSFHFGSSDNAASSSSTGWVQPALDMDERDGYSMYSNPKVYGNYGDDGMAAPMGGGGVSSLDIMGVPMGGGLTPMGQSVSENIGFDSQTEDLSAGMIDNTALQPHHPTNGTSPSESDLNLVKSKTAEAEQTFRDCTDLVRRISSEVVKLEASVKDADADVSALEGKTKKSSTFGGKKKKVKAEYDKAVEWAQMERSKLEEAKTKLVIAEREAANAEREMENMRQKCEEMEMEAATAASYWSAQQEHGGSQQKQLEGSYKQPQNHYTNSFAMAGSNNHVTQSADPYGMGFMGGATSSNDDYDNPFAM